MRKIIRLLFILIGAPILGYAVYTVLIYVLYLQGLVEAPVESSAAFEASSQALLATLMLINFCNDIKVLKS